MQRILYIYIILIYLTCKIIKGMNYYKEFLSPIKVEPFSLQPVSNINRGPLPRFPLCYPLNRTLIRLFLLLSLYLKLLFHYSLEMVALVSQENVVVLVSRTGRELQRYKKGRRQVVGFVSSYTLFYFFNFS